MIDIDLDKIFELSLPSKIDKDLAYKIKEKATLLKTHRDENAKELYFQYSFDYKKKHFILTEEYLFRENESILDIKRAIMKNYYLKMIQ